MENKKGHLKRLVSGFDVDEAAFELKCITNAVNAIHTAMTEGASPAEEWTNALYFAYRSLLNLTEKLDGLCTLEDTDGN